MSNTRFMPVNNKVLDREFHNHTWSKILLFVVIGSYFYTADVKIVCQL